MTVVGPEHTLTVHAPDEEDMALARVTVIATGEIREQIVYLRPGWRRRAERRITLMREPVTPHSLVR